jgi:hypothetical protein
VVGRDAMQQRLEPAHDALDVRVQEGDRLANRRVKPGDARPDEPLPPGQLEHLDLLGVEGRDGGRHRPLRAVVHDDDLGE